jgi:dTDP-4-amino-4,6-dideoxygalactose transaminase
VITSPYSFFATAGAIWRTGAKPVFVDIDPKTYNIDPSQIEAAITPRTKAIIPVHLYGQCAEMATISAIGRKHSLKVLEDAAQSIGAKYHGVPCGTLGDCAAFSFYPSKNLGAFGDAGMVTTDDPTLAKSVGRLRVHGMEPKYHHHEVGFNSRIDAFQAAVLRVKLRHLEKWTEGRRSVAARYSTLFHDAGLDQLIALPSEADGQYHVYNQYVIRVPEAARDALRTHMATKRVGTEIYYPIPLHLQVCFASLGHKSGDFVESERAALQTIALPMYPELSEGMQAHVVESIREYVATHGVSKSTATKAA